MVLVSACVEEYEKENFKEILHNSSPGHALCPSSRPNTTTLTPLSTALCVFLRLLLFKFSYTGLVSAFSICCQSNLSKNNINDYEMKIALKPVFQAYHLSHVSVWSHHEMLKCLKVQFLLRLLEAEGKAVSTRLK